MCDNYKVNYSHRFDRCDYGVSNVTRSNYLTFFYSFKIFQYLNERKKLVRLKLKYANRVGNLEAPLIQYNGVYAGELSQGSILKAQKGRKTESTFVGIYVGKFVIRYKKNWIVLGVETCYNDLYGYGVVKDSCLCQNEIANSIITSITILNSNFVPKRVLMPINNCKDVCYLGINYTKKRVSVHFTNNKEWGNILNGSLDNLIKKVEYSEHLSHEDNNKFWNMLELGKDPLYVSLYLEQVLKR